MRWILYVIFSFVFFVAPLLELPNHQPKIDLLGPRCASNPKIFAAFAGMSMSQSLSLRQTQSIQLTQQQKLLQKLQVRLIQTQKLLLVQRMTLEDIYKTLERILPEITESAGRRKDGIRHYQDPETGLDFEYLLVRKADDRRLPIDEADTFRSILREAGGGFAFYSKAKNRYYLVVDGDFFPEEFVDLVGIHEYGESVLEGHLEATQLEFEAARRKKKVTNYTHWLAQHHPVKFANVFTCVEELDHPLPNKIKRSRKYQKLLRERRGMSSARAARTMITDFEWPLELLKLIGKAERENQRAERIIQDQFKTIKNLAGSLPHNSLTWPQYLRVMNEQAQKAIQQIRERVDVRLLNPHLIRSVWSSERKEAGDLAAKTWVSYRQGKGQMPALRELVEAALEGPELSRFGVMDSGWDVMDLIGQPETETFSFWLRNQLGLFGFSFREADSIVHSLTHKKKAQLDLLEKWEVLTEEERKAVEQKKIDLWPRGSAKRFAEELQKQLWNYRNRISDTFRDRVHKQDDIAYAVTEATLKRMIPWKNYVQIKKKAAVLSHQSFLIYTDGMDEVEAWVDEAAKAVAQSEREGIRRGIYAWEMVSRKGRKDTKRALDWGRVRRPIVDDLVELGIPELDAWRVPIGMDIRDAVMLLLGEWPTAQADKVDNEKVKKIIEKVLPEAQKRVREIARELGISVSELKRLAKRENWTPGTLKKVMKLSREESLKVSTISSWLRIFRLNMDEVTSLVELQKRLVEKAKQKAKPIAFGTLVSKYDQLSRDMEALWASFNLKFIDGKALVRSL